ISGGLHRMSRLLAKIALFFVGAIVVAELIYGFFAYFVTSQLPDGTVVDGFGRRLVPTPSLIQFFLGHDRMWAGWQWFVAEMVVFWGAIGLLPRVDSIS